MLFSAACKSKKTTAASKENTGQSNNSKISGAKEAEFTALFVEACALRIKGNLQEALKNFEECQSLKPNDPAIRYELGMIHKLQGDNTKALDNARYSANAEPKNEWYQLLYIETCLAIKDYKQAIKIREQLVKNFPERSDFKEDLAIEYSLSGQYDKAYRLYEELEKTYGYNEQITINKVKLLRGQKKFKEAETELIKLSDSNKNVVKYYYYLADFYREQNDLDKAKIMYDKVLAIEPFNPEVNLDLYDYYIAKGQGNEAHEAMKKAFSNAELNVNTKADIIGQYYKNAEQGSLKDFTHGVELAKIMLSVHPKTAQANGIYADFLRLDGKKAEAYNYYLAATLSEKQNFKLWRNLMYIESELNKQDSLEVHSAACMEIFPALPDAYLFNGLANSRLKNYHKAVSSLKEGVNLVVDNKLMTFDFLRALGDNYFNIKNYAKSDLAFDDALKIDPDNTYVLNNYAYYLSLRNENLEKAERFSKKSNELRPNEKAYMDTYGWILYQQKKYKEAEQWLSRAAKNSTSPAILEHYGDLLFRLNKIDEALQYWNQAQQAGGNTPELLKKIKDKKLSD